MIYRKIKVLISVIIEFYKRSISITAEEKKYIEFLNNIQVRYPLLKNKNNAIILIPLMDDIGTMKVSIELAYKIAYEKGLQIKYFYVHSAIDGPVRRVSVFKYSLQQFQNFNFFWVNKLCRIYGIKRKNIIISNFFRPGFKQSNPLIYIEKKQILGITYRNIKIGELIYDTYLRFRSKYTIQLDDLCLADIANYSEKMVDLWKRKLSQYNIKILLVPYTAYHHWGIPAYVCLDSRVDVITFGSSNYILSKLSVQHPYHSKNFQLFSQKFKKNDEEGIAFKKFLARQTLDRRLGGEIDSGTSYMKQTAFSSDHTINFSPETDRNWCVIFLHCFFDSPHIYGNSLFPDFYEWIIHILTRASKNADKVFYIKEHPNALPQNRQVVDLIKELFKQYPNIIFLSGKISNQQILKEFPKAIFTVYGTVAHEFAVKGVPVVMAGQNPQSNYGFIHKPTTIDEFNYYIDNLGHFALPESYDIEEIYEFFYMNYLYYSDKYDSTNFEKVLNLEIGLINLPLEIPIDDLYF